MAVQIPQGFIIRSPEAVDDRLVLSKAQMRDFSRDSRAGNLPSIYFCVCSDPDDGDYNIYVYNRNGVMDPSSTGTGKFVKYAGSWDALTNKPKAGDGIDPAALELPTSAQIRVITDSSLGFTSEGKLKVSDSLLKKLQELNDAIQAEVERATSEEDGLKKRLDSEGLRIDDIASALAAEIARAQSSEGFLRDTKQDKLAAGDAISLTSEGIISVLYDNETIKLNGSLYVNFNSESLEYTSDGLGIKDGLYVTSDELDSEIDKLDDKFTSELNDLKDYVDSEIGDLRAYADSEFATLVYVDSELAIKQDLLTAGDFISIASDGTISVVVNDNVFEENSEHKLDLKLADSLEITSEGLGVADGLYATSSELEDLRDYLGSEFATIIYLNSELNDFYNRLGSEFATIEYVDSEIAALRNSLGSEYATIVYVDSELSKKQDTLTFGAGLENGSEGLTVKVDGTTIHLNSENALEVIGGGGGSYTASKGITIVGDDIQHTNTITAQTTQEVYNTTYDAQGHITAGQLYNPDWTLSLTNRTVASPTDSDIIKTVPLVAQGTDSGKTAVKIAYDGQTAASGSNSVAIGATAKATGNNSIAIGDFTTASAEYAVAIGVSANASAMNAQAFNNSRASGVASHAEGITTRAEGGASHTEGTQTRATNESAHAEGRNSQATGLVSHAEGERTTAAGAYSHAEGSYSKTDSLALYAHVEGGGPNAEDGTQATGSSAHAEGRKTLAGGWASHAEGCNSQATGAFSHAEGGSQYTSEGVLAGGASSHAEGQGTTASGKATHAEGYETIAVTNYQHVQGKYNVEDITGLYADIVGWGSEGVRKNISSLTTAGDLHIKQDFYFQSDDDGQNGYKLPYTVVTETGTGSKTLALAKRDHIYIYPGPITRLNVTAIENTQAITDIIFTTGGSITVNLPTGVKLPEGFAGFAANKTYEINILYNLATVTSWS